jgi:hypothetical protein
MSPSDTSTNPVAESLVIQLRAMRDAERRLFGALDPAVRDAPIRPNDWSPKDHQAHLTAWKGKQAERIRSVRVGDPFPVDAREEDEENAELQAMTADWTWDAVVAQADEVSETLAAEVLAAGDEVMLGSNRLIGGTFGNGPFHAATHFGWLVNDGIGMDAAAVEAFLSEEEQLLAAATLPDADRGTGLYNLACAHALAGRLDRARRPLQEAFRLRPDLADFAKDDPDLVALRDEFAELAAAD